MLQFWLKYFESSSQPAPVAIKEHQFDDKIRWPALLSERELPGDRYHPVIVELSPEDGHICITNVTEAYERTFDAVASPMFKCGSGSSHLRILNKWEFVNTDIRKPPLSPFFAV